ncbi:unnamed protein product, partial [Amoebophrya sp. A120]|eukprot:GSA120T00008391001.1
MSGTLSRSTSQGVNDQEYSEPRTLATGASRFDTNDLPANWEINSHWCLNEKFDDDSVAVKSDKANCVTVYRKAEQIPASLGTPKVCAVDFQAADEEQNNMLQDAANLRSGVKLVGKYHVYRRYGLLFEKFQNDVRFDPLKDFLSDEKSCKQTYITGHHLGAAVATLFRLILNGGRLVTFSSPAIFPQYSFPKSCNFGDAFHFQDDANRFTPVGFRQAGVRQNALCTS